MAGLKLTGGTSAVDVEVDSTSKAMRATLYDSAGNEIFSTPDGSYLANIDLRPGAITAGASVALWAMRNAASKTIFIRRLFLTGSVNPTTSAASSWYYSLNRFATATPTGGNAGTILKKKNSYGSSTITDIRQIAAAATSGLTTTSVVFEAAFSILTGPRHVGAVAALDLNFLSSAQYEKYAPFELAANEGFAILIPTNAAVSGDFLTGFIEWDEKA